MKEKCSIVRTVRDWLKGALRLTAVAALCCAFAGNAFADEPDPWASVRSSLSFEEEVVEKKENIGKEVVVYFLARFVDASRKEGGQNEVEKYSQQIKDNPENWEAYVNRSFARIATLWEDEKVRNFAEECGLDGTNSVLHIGMEPPSIVDGKVVRMKKPLECLFTGMRENRDIDTVCGSALPILQAAIDDLDKIPETWSDAVVITAENTGYLFHLIKQYRLDYADAQMIKAICWELMSILELARGYSPYSAGKGPDGINKKALAAARDYYVNGVRMLSAFRVAQGGRDRTLYYLFMIQPYQATNILDNEQSLLGLPYWTAEVDLTIFARNCWNHNYEIPQESVIIPRLQSQYPNLGQDEIKILAEEWCQRRVEWVDSKKAENARRKAVFDKKKMYMSLRSLFAGEVSFEKGTFPTVIRNHVMLDKSMGLTDSTCGGTFPDLDRKTLGEYVEAFDSELPEYDKDDTAVKYHAVVYTLPKGAENNPEENPATYMTDQCPIVLKDPTFEGYRFGGWSNDGEVQYGGVIPAESAQPMKFTALFDALWKYVTADGTVIERTDCVVVTADTATFEDGKWYVVTGTVERASITVNGAAHLILFDGAKLTATGSDGHAGIEVSAGNALTIYGQELGTGELVAKNTWGPNGYGGACIGGVSNGGCGTVTINGGVITAISESYGAGIGGGAYGGAGGVITINGGKVVACGMHSAGIGGAVYGAGGVVTINGGTVDASHGYTAADIGGGNSGPGATVTINGGSVKAETIQNPPINSANAAVWCVTVEVEKLNVEKLKVEVPDGYGTRDIYPIDGKVYLYLPNGRQYFAVNGQWYVADVNGAATEATPTYLPASVKVSSAKQRWPWNGKVDVGYALFNHSDAGECYRLITAVTLDGVTKAVTNELGAVSDGNYTNTVDCAALFGAGVLAPASVTMALVRKEPNWAANAVTFTLDTLAERTLDLKDGLVSTNLAYSGTGWGEPGAGTSATIAYEVGGQKTTLAGGLTGTGETAWMPTANGTYALTHVSGAAVETATITVANLTTVAITVGDLAAKRLTGKVVWNGGETSVSGESFELLMGAKGAKLVLTGEVGYRPDDSLGTASLTEDGRWMVEMSLDDLTAEGGTLVIPEAAAYGVRPLGVTNRYPWNGKIDVVASVAGLDTDKNYRLVTSLTLGGTTKLVSRELGAGRDATYTNTVDCAELFGAKAVGEVSVRLSLEQCAEENTVGPGDGQTVNATGESEVAVDAREEKEILGSAGPVTTNLTYSGNGWGEAVGSSAAIALAFNGGAAKPFKTGLTGEGTVLWKPKFSGTYVFTHTAGDKTETATFNAVRFPGGEDNPWEIGAGDASAVTAYVKDGYLYLGGTGEVAAFDGDAPWAVCEQLGYPLAGAVLPRTVTVPASVAATLPISVKGGEPVPEPPPGAVTSWDELTNAVATVESGAEIAVGADITEAGGELVVPKDKAVTIRLYGNTVTCRRVTVGGALTVGDADDSVGKIVASDGAQIAKRGGSVTLLNGPMRGTYTAFSPGLALILK